MKNGKWDLRIRRASQLASAHPFASEGLEFYRHVLQFQKSLYSDLQKECGTAKEPRPAGALRQELDLFLLLPRFSAFLAVIEKSAPAALARSAGALRGLDGARWQELLTEFWGAGPSFVGTLAAADALISWIFLQPYAEYLADYTHQPPLHSTPSVCPLCSSRPQVGVLRPEGDGGKRALICALCANEWAFRRLVCPACGEEDVHKLAVYTAKEFPHVRVEACDACRAYINTVDLTKDGHAVPVVDELATVPLNLWAVEHGYTKIQTNLLGI
ncbi:MAG TPA: formate dehydrogenase accessory protein FdhE [Candidatus Sulfotelmatobacter sp.]|nr:formate dehydrogenase accessory protein FdhE [Candidatus Sulfotelmatobacter sp.]